MDWVATFLVAGICFMLCAGARGRPLDALATWRDIAQAAAIATLLIAWLSDGHGCGRDHAPDSIEDCRPAGPGIAGC